MNFFRNALGLTVYAGLSVFACTGPASVLPDIMVTEAVDDVGDAKSDVEEGSQCGKYATLCDDFNPCTTDTYLPDTNVCSNIWADACELEYCAIGRDGRMCSPAGYLVDCLEGRETSWDMGCGSDEFCIRGKCQAAIGCEVDADCADAPGRPLCAYHLSNVYRCVECRVDSDCGGCGRCEQNTCTLLQTCQPTAEVSECPTDTVCVPRDQHNRGVCSSRICFDSICTGGYYLECGKDGTFGWYLSAGYTVDSLWCGGEERCTPDGCK